MNLLSRRSFIAAAASTLLLAGCSNSAQGSGQSSAASSGSASAAGATVTVGTLATEDILPLWVAEAEGLFAEQGIGVEVVTFQSATELIAGVASGEVDAAMTDIMVTASMFAGDVDVQMEWVTLGATAAEGRFGIMVGPNSDIEKLTDLAGVPIGVGSNTILEYVMDTLMEGAGVPADQVVVEEIQKLPVRYQSMLSGEVAAAALPGTLLALGEANGCKLIADDTQGDNISQSVMIARSEYVAGGEGAQQMEALASIWDEAAKMINENPENYRSVLVEHANLPADIADTYPISAYPTAALPTNAMVDPVLDWMKQKGYLTAPVSYDEKTGIFSK